MRVFLILLLINQFVSFSQSEGNFHKNKKFEFCSEKKRSTKFNFIVNQEFLNDTTFRLKGILCNDTSYLCEIKFSQSVNGWLIWDGSKWENLFSQQKKINKLHLRYADKMISPKEIYAVNNDTLFSFSCKNENVDFSTDNNLYYFSLSKGIIAVSNPETFFKRDDYFVEDLMNKLTIITW